jgi:ankyrin repeat protein
MAFCDAVNRNDAAAAKAIFEGGQIDMLARDASARCQPGLELFQAARPQSAEFTAMAVTFAKREGIANTCWTGSRGSGGSGCAIEVAAQNANAAVMRALVDAGVDVTNQKARSALGDAATQGSLEIVRMLVEKGADPSAAINVAVARRQPAIVEYLESKGATEDVDPLLVAARRGDLPAVDAAIARHANLEAADSDGRTPLIRAALYGHAAVVTRLVKAGARADAVTTEDKHSALLIAANEGHVAVIQALAAAKADMNIRAGADAPTPLLGAVVNGKVESVRALLAAGADPNVWTESDTTAIRRAAVQGNLAMVKALLAAGARVNEAHGAGWQPPILGLLGICGHAPEGDGENDYYRVTLMKALVAAGADGKAKDAQGQTPIEIVSKLLAGAEGDFYKACYQAKLDYLKTL